MLRALAATVQRARAHPCVESALGRSGRPGAGRARALESTMPGDASSRRSPTALDAAWRAAPRIVVAGSIFLLGDVMKQLALGRDTLRCVALVCCHATTCPPLRCCRDCLLRRSTRRASRRTRVRLRRRRARRRNGSARTISKLRRRRRTRAEGHASSTPTRSSIFVDQDRAIATRQRRLLTQGNNRIAADRADFNTKTAPRHLLQRQRHRDDPAAAAGADHAGRVRPAAVTRQPTPTSTSSARSSRRSAPRNTRSPTAASRPASSRRRAGTCTPTPSC